MTYCYRCPECGSTAESFDREIVPTCWGYAGEKPHGPMKRDYQAEAVNVDKSSLK